jgi:rubrerythrin
MNQSASLGTNKTGSATAPQRLKEMLSGLEPFLPQSAGNAQAIANVRIAYATEAEPVGSVPMPVSLTGAVKTAVKAVTGASPTLFIDKLGERLAFERSGVRLYETLLSKYDAYGSFSGGPSREDLQQILDDEFNHFTMLTQTMEQLGGDPTAVTPSANLHATLSMGIIQVLTDPRTTLLQSLEGILVAELADNDCWETLTELAQGAGEEEMKERLLRAYATEQEHLEKVRSWLAAGQGRTQLDGGNSGNGKRKEQKKRDS